MSTRTPDDDPTGVRQLLAGLSDPLPPHEDLTERINASLREAEQDYVQRFDPALDRPGRRRWPLGAAAAGLGVLALVALPAMTPMLQDRAHTAMAAFTGVADAHPAATGEAQTVQAALPEAAHHTTPDSPSASSRVPHLRIVASGIAYRGGRLQSQVRRLMSHATPPSPPTAISADDLHTCLGDLALAGDVLVDVATYDTHRALIVVRDTTDEPSVTVLPATCAHGARTPMAGPLRLP